MNDSLWTSGFLPVKCRVKPKQWEVHSDWKVLGESGLVPPGSREFSASTRSLLSCCLATFQDLQAVIGDLTIL